MCVYSHMWTVSQKPGLWTLAFFSEQLLINPFPSALPTKYKLKTTKQNNHLPFLCLNFCFQLLYTWVYHRYQIKMPKIELPIFPLPSKSVKTPLLLHSAFSCFALLPLSLQNPLHIISKCTCLASCKMSSQSTFQLPPLSQL